MFDFSLKWEAVLKLFFNVLSIPHLGRMKRFLGQILAGITLKNISNVCDVNGVLNCFTTVSVSSF
jgi:hypothetical protein